MPDRTFTVAARTCGRCGGCECDDGNTTEGDDDPVDPAVPDALAALPDPATDTSRSSNHGETDDAAECSAGTRVTIPPTRTPPSGSGVRESMPVSPRKIPNRERWIERIGSHTNVVTEADLHGLSDKRLADLIVLTAAMNGSDLADDKVDGWDLSRLYRAKETIHRIKDTDPHP